MPAARIPCDGVLVNDAPQEGGVRLGALEQQVMDTLWDEGPLTIRQVIDQLGGTLAYTTIATVARNLERKGLARAVRDGRTLRYTAREPREVHAAHLMESALARSNDRAASIMHFVDSISDEDARLLREYLGRSGDVR